MLAKLSFPSYLVAAEVPLSQALVMVAEQKQQQQQEVRFEESYAYDDADLVLRSSDGAYFRVHSTVLKLASAFFRDMLALPKPSPPLPSLGVGGGPLMDFIPMDERKEVLKALLDVIYPNSTTDFIVDLDFETFRDLMFILIHKYDIYAGSRIAKTIYHDDRLSFSPILMFGAMRHIGWVEEAKKASTATLSHNLYLNESQANLRRLSVQHALELMSFHQRRRKQLKEYLDLPPTGFTATKLRCEEHRGGMCLSIQWGALQNAVLTELDVDPSGSRMHDLEFLPREIRDGLTDLKSSCHCGTEEERKKTLNLDPEGFPKLFARAVQQLPQTVDD